VHQAEGSGHGGSPVDAVMRRIGRRQGGIAHEHSPGPVQGDDIGMYAGRQRRVTSGCAWMLLRGGTCAHCGT
jgi:hypothetical protein